MKEVELKILEIDVDSVANKLESLGAKKVFDGKIAAWIYDFPDSRISKANCLLRLRMKGDEVEFAFKQKDPLTDVKSAEETEVNVSDIEKMDKILLGIGLIKNNGITKQRISYCLEDAHFEMDTYPGVPTFLEIETHAPEDTKEWVKKLGFSEKDAKPWSGKDVLKHYGIWK